MKYLLTFSLLLSSDLDSAIPGLRFLKYIVVVYALINVIINSQVAVKPHAKWLFFLVSYSLLMKALGVHNTIDYEEIIIYIGSAIVLLSDITKSLKMRHFVIPISLYTIYAFVANGIEFNIQGLILGDFSPIESNILAFVITVLLSSIYRFKNSLTLFPLFLLYLKRITTIAYGVILYVKKNRNSWIIPVMSLGSIIVFNAFRSMAIVDSISERLGISLGLLTMGRSTYWVILNQGIDTSLIARIFGEGLSYGRDILESEIGKRFLLHNDWVKLYIETGVIGFLGFLYFFRKELSFKYFVLLGIFMLTDNVSVYFTVIVMLDWLRNEELCRRELVDLI